MLDAVLRQGSTRQGERSKGRGLALAERRRTPTRQDGRLNARYVLGTESCPAPLLGSSVVRGGLEIPNSCPLEGLWPRGDAATPLSKDPHTLELAIADPLPQTEEVEDLAWVEAQVRAVARCIPSSLGWMLTQLDIDPSCGIIQVNEKPAEFA